MSDPLDPAAPTPFAVSRDGVRVTWSSSDTRVAAALDALVWWLADALPGGAQRDRGDVVFASIDEAELAMAAARTLDAAARVGDPFERLGALDALELPPDAAGRLDAVRSAVGDAPGITVRETEPTRAATEAAAEVAEPVESHGAPAEFESIGGAQVPVPHVDDVELPAAGDPGRWTVVLVHPGTDPARTFALVELAVGGAASDDEAAESADTIARGLAAHEVRALYHAIVPATGASLQLVVDDGHDGGPAIDKDRATG